jgi:hypothetical protein
MDTQKQKGPAMNLPAIPNLNPKFTVTPTGIVFFGDLSPAEWDDLGSRLAPIAKSIALMLGDWINYGSKAYGYKYNEAMKVTGLAEKTLRNHAYVARNVGHSLRDPSLGQEHHAAVAPLEPHLQKHWLGLAKEHNLSIPRLRKSIQAGRLVTEEEMEDAKAGQTNHVKLINRLVCWLTSETCKAPVEEWDADRREAIKRDFQPLLEICGQL